MVLYIKETTKIQLNTKIANYSSEAPSILDLTSNGPIKNITSLKRAKSSSADRQLEESQPIYG